METTVAPPEPSTRPSFLARHQFLIYRLFSLCGIVPIGGYVVIHLLTNATIVDGPATFQAQVDRIHQLGVILPLVEWTFIFIPILFHAVVGWFVISGALPNLSSYPYSSNLRYTLQRVTGMIAFFFIMAHVIHMHQLIGEPFRGLGGAQFQPEHASSSAAQALQPLWVQIFYAVGVLAAVYHLANGLWTFGITWGIWTSPRGQRRASYVAAAFGVVLAVIGLSALWGMRSVNIPHARQVEDNMIKVRELMRGEAPLSGTNLPESK